WGRERERGCWSEAAVEKCHRLCQTWHAGRWRNTDSRRSVADGQAKEITKASSDLVPTAISLKDLRKRYGSIEAVSGISMEVRESEIFGLIGPDGAGKTSTFQILA